MKRQLLLQRRVLRETLAAAARDVRRRKRGGGGGTGLAEWEGRIPHAFMTVAVDDSTALYTKCTRTGRPYQVWRHQTGCHGDLLLYQNDDPHCTVGVSLTRDRQFATLNANTRTSSEVHLLPLGSVFSPSPTADEEATSCYRDTSRTAAENCFPGALLLVREREEGVEYYIEHFHHRFYVFTNLCEAREYKVMVAATDKPRDWSDLYIPRSGLVLYDMEVFQKFLVLYGAKQQVPVAMVMDADGISSSKDPILLCNPEASHLDRLVEEDCGSSCLSFHFSTPVTPPTSLLFDGRHVNKVESCDSQVRSHDHSPCLRPTQGVGSYKTERVFAISEDGTQVPVTLCYRGDKLSRNHGNPLLMHVYGAYGERLNLNYQPETIPLVDRGWLLAFCHVRGGGELGRRWYYEGQGMDKHNTFKDLRACLLHLHLSGLSQPSLTALHGRSAGAMAAAMLCNLWPSLLQAAILQVPFVDVLSALSNPSHYLSVKDHLEFANPQASQLEKDYVASICPKSTLRTQDYPAMLVMAAKSDEVIPFEGVSSYVEKLRQHCREFKDSKLQKRGERNSGRRSIFKFADDSLGFNLRSFFKSAVSRGDVLFDVDHQFGHYGSPDALHNYTQASKQLVFLHKALKLPLH